MHYLCYPIVIIGGKSLADGGFDLEGALFPFLIELVA
jgi:hypothetical protein